jgi:hypothetical protein
MLWGTMWYWWVALAVGGAIVTLNLHELAHCLVVWIKGGRVMSYKPYPHCVGGTFFFGRMTYTLPFMPYRTYLLWFHSAPQLKALFLLALWVLLGLILWRPLLVLAAWELSDLLNFLQGYIRNSKSDGGKFRRALKGR